MRNQQELTEHQKLYSKIIAKCWSDPDFKKRLMANPSIILSKYGVEIPKGQEIKVIENTSKNAYLVMQSLDSASREMRNQIKDVDSNELKASATFGSAGSLGTAGTWCGTVGTAACLGTAGSWDI